MIKLRVQDWDQFILRSISWWSSSFLSVVASLQKDHPMIIPAVEKLKRGIPSSHPKSIPSSHQQASSQFICLSFSTPHQTTTSISLIDDYWDSRIQSIWQLRIFENEYIIILTNHQNKGLGSTTSSFSSNVSNEHTIFLTFSLSGGSLLQLKMKMKTRIVFSFFQFSFIGPYYYYWKWKLTTEWITDRCECFCTLQKFVNRKMSIKNSRHDFLQLSLLNFTAAFIVQRSWHVL